MKYSSEGKICFCVEGQQSWNDPYSSQRYRYNGPRNHRGGGGGGGNYRYNNNLNDYQEDSYITSGQSQTIPTKKSQHTSSNNGVSSNDVSGSETLNGGGGGPKGQRTSKPQSNGVK